jgi:nucleoside-diphosphate-sugar epimerase
MTPPTIFLTGATGFVGGATAAELVVRPNPYRLFLLARAETPGAAEARLRRSLARFLSPSLLEQAWLRITLIHGDLTDPGTFADPRLDAVTHVLHLAANTSFRSVRAVRHTNILGTMTLAHRMRRVPGLQRFLYVSTAYISGADPSPVVHEDDYPRYDVRHIAEYTASKAECEMLLEQTAPELPLIVARPSVVVGHTRLGCLPSASIFWYYRTLDLLRRVPFPLTTRRDIVPVDYTATALLHLLFKDRLRYRRYHVSAGESASASWQEIASAFADTRPEGTEEAYQVVDHATIVKEQHRLLPLLGRGDESQLLATLELFFRFSSSGVQMFDNNRILEEGMPPPPRFPCYLPTCVALPSERSVYEQMRDDC